MDSDKCIENSEWVDCVDSEDADFIEDSNCEMTSPVSNLQQSKLVYSSSLLTSPQKSAKHEKCIAHIDMDCFYAQVEMLLDPKLRNVPLGVRQKYIIVTSNYKARELGVGKMSTLADAKRICPQLVVVNGENLDKYRVYSERVYELWHRYSDKVEKLGLDENFIDITTLVEERLRKMEESCDVDESAVAPGYVIGLEDVNHSFQEIGQHLQESCDGVCRCGCRRRLVMASQIVLEMRSALEKEIGLTSCGGIAHNKLFAKMAGEQHKPNKQTTIFPEQSAAFIQAQPFKKIPGIGNRARMVLDAHGVETMADVARIARTIIGHWFGGRFGDFIWNAAHGIDNRCVENSGEAKSLSEEDTYRDMGSVEKVKQGLLTLLELLIQRVTRHSGCPKTLRLSIRKRINGETQKRESRQATLLLNADMSSLDERDKVIITLLGQLLGLLGKMLDMKKPFNLALLNVGVTNFEYQTSNRTGVDHGFFKAGPSSESMAGDIISGKLGNSSKAVGLLEHECENNLKRKSSVFREIPPDIDPEIFGNLPIEIREELKLSWRLNSTSSDSTTSTPPHRKRSKSDGGKNTSLIANYFKPTR